MKTFEVVTLFDYSTYFLCTETTGSNIAPEHDGTTTMLNSCQCFQVSKGHKSTLLQPIWLRNDLKSLISQDAVSWGKPCQNTIFYASEWLFERLLLSGGENGIFGALSMLFPALSDSSDSVFLNYAGPYPWFSHPLNLNSMMNWCSLHFFFSR